MQAQGQQQVTPQHGSPRALIRGVRPAPVFQFQLQGAFFLSTMTGGLQPEHLLLLLPATHCHHFQGAPLARARACHECVTRLCVVPVGVVPHSVLPPFVLSPLVVMSPLDVLSQLVVSSQLVLSAALGGSLFHQAILLSACRNKFFHAKQPTT